MKINTAPGNLLRVPDSIDPPKRPTEVKPDGLFIPAEPKPSIGQTFWDDIHTNLSGLVMFSFAATAILWPEHKDQCNELAAVAGAYLFGNVKKNSDK